jgi:hypothetical protein
VDLPAILVKAVKGQARDEIDGGATVQFVEFTWTGNVIREEVTFDFAVKREELWSSLHL